MLWRYSVPSRATPVSRRRQRPSLTSTGAVSVPFGPAGQDKRLILRLVRRARQQRVEFRRVDRAPGLVHQRQDQRVALDPDRRVPAQRLLRVAADIEGLAVGVARRHLHAGEGRDGVPGHEDIHADDDAEPAHEHRQHVPAGQFAALSRAYPRPCSFQIPPEECGVLIGARRGAQVLDPEPEIREIASAASLPGGAMT
jgi:hypothetical protein